MNAPLGDGNIGPDLQLVGRVCPWNGSSNTEFWWVGRASRENGNKEDKISYMAARGSMKWEQGSVFCAYDGAQSRKMGTLMMIGMLWRRVDP